ncbi:MAG: PIN domain-containing protein [Acidobacteriia bacterium]|nr:PIN domain-containing protein [Terriglobia bacterium]
MARRAARSVKRPSVFWDTSALVPLCVRQGSTPRALELYKTSEVVVWWTTPVEIASALARLVRMKQLSSGDWAKARKLATALADTWSVIQPSDAVRAQAVRLVDRYDLRAADALQLAAALIWCEDVPQGRAFLTTDQKLQEAAMLSGFDAQQI